MPALWMMKGKRNATRRRFRQLRSFVLFYELFHRRTAMGEKVMYWLCSESFEMILGNSMQILSNSLLIFSDSMQIPGDSLLIFSDSMEILGNSLIIFSSS